MFSKSFSTLPEAWITVLRHIHDEGEVNTTEYGTKSRFVNGVMVEITDYKEEWHPNDPYCTARRIAEYKKQFEYGYKHDFDYTYMDRLTSYIYPYVSGTGFFGGPFNKYSISYLDQVASVKNHLMDKQKYESKRVQMITWQPNLDLFSEHPPCLQRIWFYPRLNNTVDIHINYRSWDWFQAAESNVIGIMDMLTREILQPCRFRVNAVRLIGDNVHYYLENEDQVKAALK